MNNKKGTISDEVLLFIPRMIFLIAVVFAFILLVKVLLVTKIYIKQVESEILVNRLLFSQGGLSYYDGDIGRLYPGIIDLKGLNKISESNPNILDDEIISYGKDNPIITAKITLKQENKDDIVLFYNKGKFDKWEPRALSGIRGGAGSVKTFKEQKYVLVNDGENLNPAILEFFIIS